MSAYHCKKWIGYCTNVFPKSEILVKYNTQQRWEQIRDRLAAFERGSKIACERLQSNIWRTCDYTTQATGMDIKIFRKDTKRKIWQKDHSLVETYWAENEVGETFKNLNQVLRDEEDEWGLFQNGRTSGKCGVRRKQQWGWTEEARDAVKAKRDAQKAVEETEEDRMKKEFTRTYRIIKNKAKKVVALAKSAAERKLYESVENDSGRNLVYRLAKARHREGRTQPQRIVSVLQLLHQKWR